MMVLSGTLLMVNLNFINFNNMSFRNKIKPLLQGSHESLKTWKVLEFDFGIFQVWKVLEKGCWSWKVLEIC